MLMITALVKRGRFSSLSIGVVASVLFALLIGTTLLVRISTHAAAPTCPAGNRVYQVVAGDTVSIIAARSNTTAQAIVNANQLANPDIIDIGQQICIPTTTSGQQQVSQGSALSGPGSSGNFYPAGQCTWWANQRYFQIHQVYVPWTTNADAWQWTARAEDFHWQVDTVPQVGDVIDLQPNVQGAGGKGHVAIVESILPNGHVLTSNLNWGATPGQLATVEFVPGAGVTFLRV